MLHRHLAADAVGVANATELLVSEDGGPPLPWSLAALRDALQENGESVLDLELRNERAVDQACATERVRLRISVPEVEDLAGVDAAFLTLPDELDERVVDAHVDESRVFVSAARYAGALDEYLVGILIKDGAPGTGEALSFEVFREKYSRALDVLREFPQRPVARAVSGFLRFNLNDFAGGAPNAGIPALDNCAARLTAIAGQPGWCLQAADRGVAGACPADDVTSQIPDDWSGATTQAGSKVARLLDRADLGTTSPANAAKCRALALDLSGGEYGEERLLAAARALSGDLTFGSWAKEIVEDAHHP